MYACICQRAQVTVLPQGYQQPKVGTVSPSGIEKPSKSVPAKRSWGAICAAGIGRFWWSTNTPEKRIKTKIIWTNNLKELIFLVLFLIPAATATTPMLTETAATAMTK